VTAREKGKGQFLSNFWPFFENFGYVGRKYFLKWLQLWLHIEFFKRLRNLMCCDSFTDLNFKFHQSTSYPTQKMVPNIDLIGSLRPSIVLVRSVGVKKWTGNSPCRKKVFYSFYRSKKMNFGGLKGQNQPKSLMIWGKFRFRTLQPFIFIQSFQKLSESIYHQKKRGSFFFWRKKISQKFFRAKMKFFTLKSFIKAFSFTK